MADEQDVAVSRFQDFLRIPSISGEGPRNGSYARAVDWLTAQCEAIGLEVQTVSPVENKPILMAKLPGRDPSLSCILLNSHYDVVPVMRDHWCCDPFAAEIRDGYMGPQVPPDMPPAGPCIYARGTQDMKCVCCQYLEALRRLRSTGWQPLRTIWLTFVPDEEIGGADGMGLFLKTGEFESIKPIALALDEGLANPRPAFTVFYGRREGCIRVISCTTVRHPHPISHHPTPTHPNTSRPIPTTSPPHFTPSNPIPSHPNPIPHHRNPSHNIPRHPTSSPTPGERTPWWLIIRAEGPTGHGSR